MGTSSTVVAQGMVAFAAAAILCFVAPAAADPARQVFLPTEVDAYADSSHASYTILSNRDLVIRANQLRGGRLSPSQRAMNYQWLSEHSGNEDAIRGDKAITKLLERHLENYLDRRQTTRWIKQKLLEQGPDGNVRRSFDYDVRLRSDNVVIGVRYEF